MEYGRNKETTRGPGNQPSPEKNHENCQNNITASFPAEKSETAVRQNLQLIGYKSTEPGLPDPIPDFQSHNNKVIRNISHLGKFNLKAPKTEIKSLETVNLGTLFPLYYSESMESLRDLYFSDESTPISETLIEDKGRQNMLAVKPHFYIGNDNILFNGNSNYLLFDKGLKLENSQISIFGSNNVIQTRSNINASDCFIRIVGSNNSVDLGSISNLNNVNIEIEGNDCEIQIGSSDICESSIIIRGGNQCRIKIGEKSKIRWSLVYSQYNSEVTVGQGCFIGDSVIQSTDISGNIKQIIGIIENFKDKLPEESNSLNVADSKNYVCCCISGKGEITFPEDKAPASGFSGMSIKQMESMSLSEIKNRYELLKTKYFQRYEKINNRLKKSALKLNEIWTIRWGNSRSHSAIDHFICSGPQKEETLYKRVIGSWNIVKTKVIDPDKLLINDFISKKIIYSSYFDACPDEGDLTKGTETILETYLTDEGEENLIINGFRSSIRYSQILFSGDNNRIKLFDDNMINNSRVLFLGDGNRIEFSFKSQISSSLIIFKGRGNKLDLCSDAIITDSKIIIEGNDCSVTLLSNVELKKTLVCIREGNNNRIRIDKISTVNNSVIYAQGNADIIINDCCGIYRSVIQTTFLEGSHDTVSYYLLHSNTSAGDKTETITIGKHSRIEDSSVKGGTKLLRSSRLKNNIDPTRTDTIELITELRPLNINYIEMKDIIHPVLPYENTEELIDRVIEKSLEDINQVISV